MILWGETNDTTSFNTGRYCARSGPTATPSPEQTRKPRSRPGAPASPDLVNKLNCVLSELLYHLPSWHLIGSCLKPIVRENSHSRFFQLGDPA